MLRLLLIACALLLRLLPNSGAATQFSLIGDIDLDPAFGTPNAYGTCTSYKSTSLLGDTGCESPITLAFSVSSDCSLQKSSYTMFTGAWSRHKAQEVGITVDDVFFPLSLSLNTIGTTGSIAPPTLAAAVGGTDFRPSYHFDYAASEQPDLSAAAAVLEMRQLLLESEKSTFTKCGYYVRDASDTLRIVVLNTVIYSRDLQPAVAEDVEDPCGQLAFLREQLEGAASASKKVILMGNIPPTVNVTGIVERGQLADEATDLLWIPRFQKAYLTLVSAHAETVALQVFGHTYRFSLVADPAMGSPLITLASVTPLMGNTPSYMIAELNNTRWSLKSIIQRHVSTSAIWSSTDTLESLLGFSTYDNLTALQKDIAAWLTSDKHWNAYTHLAAGGADTHCTTTFCRAATVCAMEHIDIKNIQTCVTDALTPKPTTTPPIPRVSMPQPRYHIRPPEHWINDPNGPYRDPVTGKIHLYMQYNPWGALWGNMSWYHVTSEDYVKWRHEPVAMYNDLWYNHWGVYSGGMQNNNLSVPVVVYTCVEVENLQRQCIANPTKQDVEGRRLFNEFVQSPLNPIITEDDVPGFYSLENFRDPTDWWVDPTDPNKWLIAFAVRATTEADGDSAHVVVFSTSDPSFQSGYNFSHFMYSFKYDPDNMFECPDFFKLDDYPEHFLKLSTMPPHRDYFVYGSYELNSATGKYDFVADPERTFTWADFGPYYASKSFNDPILNRRLYWGWMQEELTNEQILAQGWSGVQTLMRDVEYDTVEKKLRLFPAGELKALRQQKVYTESSIAVTSTPKVILPPNGAATRFHEIVAKFTIADTSVFSSDKYYTDSTAPEFGVMIRTNEDLSKYATVAVRMPAATSSPIQNQAQDTRYSILKNWTVDSATVCEAQCKLERTCETWTYISSSKECHLYWKASERVSQSGSISGTVNEPWFYFGRGASGTTGWDDPLHGRGPLTKSHPNEVELHIFVDDTVIEAFKDGGLETISGHVYLPDAPEQTGIAVYSKNMGAVTVDLTVYTMGDIWAAPEPPSAVTNFTDSLNTLLTNLVE